jgi:UDP-N-acetylglucosamine 2-epimerase (non-hydrolysing)
MEIRRPTKAVKNLLFIFGTRPEITKLYPYIYFCEKNHIPYKLIHTGQHYDKEMKQVLWKQLSLPKASHSLDLKEKHHPPAQLGEMIYALAHVMKDYSSELWNVVVQGDTHSTLAAALVAKKLGFSLAHIEAGCRSFLSSQPEEQNRIMIDHISQLNIAIDKESLKQLTREGINSKNLLLPGSTFSMCHLMEKKIKKAKFTNRQYILVTVHRAENTQNEKTFKKIVSFLKNLSKTVEILWVLHPRLRNHPNVQAEKVGKTQLLPPQDYLSFLSLVKNAQAIISDSGGLVDEALWFSKPLIILRHETERMEVVKSKKAILLSPKNQSLKQMDLMAHQYLLKKYLPFSAKEKKHLISGIKTAVTHLRRC